MTSKKTKKNDNFKKGSEWRKWDLHVHTPETKKNDNYEIINGDVWEEFYEKIEKSSVDVFGITDYFSVENYIKVKDEFYKKHPDSKKVFFPNVEINIDRSSNGGVEGYNVHVILDNELSDEKLEKFIDNLKLDTKDEEGLNIKAFEIKEKLKNGYENAYTTKELLEEAFSDSFGKNNPYLVVTVLHGYRGMQTSQQAQGNRGEVAMNTAKELTDIYFGCDEKDRKFVLSKKIEGKFKPMITGSDVHSFIDIDNKLGKKFINNPNEIIEKQRNTFPTWIKANSTFEGLKQIIHEPEERVAIQEENPEKSKKHWKLKSIIIKNSQNELIKNQEILFNSGLVSVIGGRGTGKTGLLELLLLPNGNNNNGVVDFFLTKGDFDLVYNFTDKDGEDLSYDFKLSNLYELKNHSLPIYYLSQKDIESFSRNTKEIRENFLQDLKIDNDLDYYNEEINTAKNLIEKLKDIKNRKIEIMSIFPDFLEKENQELFCNYCDQQIETLKKEKEKYSTIETKKILEKISKITTRGFRLNEIKESKIIFNLKTLALDLNNKIDEYSKLFEDEEGLKKRIENFDKYKVEDINIKNLDNQKEIEVELKGLREEYVKNVKLLKVLGVSDHKNITELIEQKNKRIIKLGDAKKELKELDQEKKETEEELLKISKQYLGSIENAIQDIDEKVKEFKKDRNELFNKVFEDINISGKVYFDIGNFKEELNKLFFSQQNILVNNLFGEIENNDYGAFFEIFKEDLWDKILKKEKSFKQRGEYFIFLEIIFQKCMEYIQVRPEIRLKDMELNEMSGGQQATLLLKFKLACEGLENDVLILDQPENHLDNNFICKNLNDLIRKLKKEKQVIVASHNANIVVGADSEEVIVSRLDEKEEYILGAIEDNKIRENIINILEGGELAFIKRGEKTKIIKNKKF